MTPLASWQSHAQAPAPARSSIFDIHRIFDEAGLAHHILHDVSPVSPEFVAITGPSGSGKSTLMNILGCLDTPTSGTYLLEGLNVAELTDDELAGVRALRIGFVFQSCLLPRMRACRQWRHICPSPTPMFPDASVRCAPSTPCAQ
ncbi:MAG: ATP-binding cassette domain-containing protein [Collinsella sp.]